MNNALRSELLAQTKKAQQLGFKGSIMDVLSNPMVLQEFTQQQNRSRVEVASTPQQQQQGLSGVPANQMPEAMVFPNVKPNTSFNTEDMLASINIQKYDNQGHLVKSYENVPPGITNLPMGPQEGTVIETPANVAQSGGVKRYQGGGVSTLYVDRNDPRGKERYQAYQDSLNIHNATIGSVMTLKNIVNSTTDPNLRRSKWHDYLDRTKTLSQNAMPSFQRLNYPSPELTYTSPEGLYAQSFAKPIQPVEYRPIESKRPKIPVPERLNPTGPNNNPLPERNIVDDFLFRVPPKQRKQTIMRQDNSGNRSSEGNPKGQYPIGERIWDDKRKQWVEDRWSREDQQYSADLTRQKNKPPIQRDLGKVTFQNGGPKTYQSGGLKKYQIAGSTGKRFDLRVSPYTTVAESTGTLPPVFQSREATEAQGQTRFFNQTVQEADRVAAITGDKPNYEQAQQTVTTGRQPEFVVNRDDPKYLERAEAYRNKYGIEIDDPTGWERLANPLAQAEYYNRYGELPNRAQMDLESTYGNPYDLAGAIYNPFSYVQSGIDAANAASKGNYGEAALSGLGVLPGYYGIQGARALGRQVSPLVKKGADAFQQAVRGTLRPPSPTATVRNYDPSLQIDNIVNRFSQPSPEQLRNIAARNNQLPPPPSEIQFMPDGTTRTIYNQQPITGYVSGSYTPDYIDLRRPTQYNRDLLSADYANLVNGYPQGSSFMNYPNLTREQVEQAWRTLNNRVQTTPKPKTSINKSGLTKEEVLQKALAKDKDKISKMSKTEFENTVLKPNGEIAPYYQGSLEPQFSGSQNVGALSKKEYVDEFNSRLDLLNDIIAQRNKSGVEYRVKGLDENGRLTFYTPQQSIKQGDVALTIPSGESSWGVRLNPGQWRGNVEDIANTEYFRSIPGLEMSNTTSGVFADRVARKGTGAYESINEYLKRLDLGRVKPGFNSQTDYSRGAWENFIKSGRGVGFYANPRTVYGTMKTIFPPAAIIGAGAAAAGSEPKMKDLGKVSFQTGGLKKYQSGTPTSPPKKQSYLSDLYNTGKKYLSPFVSEISEEAQAFIADKWPSVKNFGIESAKDLTGIAFDTIVSPPKVDEETGKKAEPSFYDNWVYAPIRNMSTSVLPSNIVALKQSMEGIETPLENSFFPSSELKDIYSLVQRAKADGRNYVTYTDYNPVGNVMDQKSVSGYLGNQEKVRTTLGQFTFEEDPQTGVITIKDTYDFNPSTLDAHNVSKFTKQELSKKKPSELLDLGYNYYINQGKNEATAMYLSTRYWVAPYHAKGNPPVNLTLNPEDYKDVEADRSNQTTTPNVGTNEFRSGGKKAKYKSPKMY